MTVRTIITKSFGEEINVVALVLELGACKSKSEAKRLVRQGAVDIDGKKVGRIATIFHGSVVRCGHLFFRQLQLPPKKLTFEKNRNEVKILAVESLP